MKEYYFKLLCTLNFPIHREKKKRISKKLLGNWAERHEVESLVSLRYQISNLDFITLLLRMEPAI